MSEISPAPMTDALRDALSRPFEPQMIRIKRVPKRPDMAYVSHGAVTKRLNDVYPGWHAEMVERWVVEQGGQLHCLGGIMRLTIGGVTREEAGGPTQLRTLADDLKNTYSDCLKRCAMRFGVALDMWESADEGDEDAELPNYGANAVKDHAPIGPPASAYRPTAATSAPRSNGSAPPRVATPPAAQNGAPKPPPPPGPGCNPDDLARSVRDAWLRFNDGKSAREAKAPLRTLWLAGNLRDREFIEAEIDRLDAEDASRAAALGQPAPA